MTFHRFKFHGRDHRRGFALVLVLGIVILTTLIVVGFLAHALAQTKSVTSYRAQTDSLLLGDVAVNLVKAQIDDATSKANSIWASQPGAIRTFKNDGSDATFGTTYKLYSSSSLTSTAPTTDIPKDLPAASDSKDWNASPLWTDLNAPVQKSDGTYSYPIIDAYNDPADLPGVKLTGANAPPSSFTIGSNNVGAITPLSTTTPASIYPIPMPVQWLYILKQGQIIAPDATSASPTATFNSASTVPTADNPIVGRVAYWTDDETCRVNINTASVNGTASSATASSINTFWDTPRFTATDDYLLGLYQPSSKEYQRYPGHPAMTTLALALPEFTDTSGNVSTANLKSILSLTPRYGNGYANASGVGGSVGGTILSTSQVAPILNTNRLFTSVNELLFNPPGTTRTTNGTETSNPIKLTRQQLETAKFFLTAHSRAPELNLSGMPRISIWPVSSPPAPAPFAQPAVAVTNYTTTTDKLLAFCATTNPSATTPSTYYFTRAPFTEQAGTLPASGVSNTAVQAGSNSPTYDVNIARNVSLLTYLDNLTSLPVPGFLGSGASTTFQSKYTQLGMRQILTEIFDYIRITNSRDPGLDSTLAANPAGSMPYAASTAYNSATLDDANGYGQIIPTDTTGLGSPTQNPASTLGWGTYGFGRFQGIVVGAQIIFVGVGKGPPVTVPGPQVWTAGSYIPVAPQNVSSFGTPTGVTWGPESNLYYASSARPLAVNPNFQNPFSASVADATAYQGPAPAQLIPPPGDTAVEAVFSLTYFDPALGYARNTPWVDVLSTGLTTSLAFTTSASVTPNVTQALFSTETGERLGGQNGTAYANLAGANPSSLGSLMDFREMMAGRTFTKTTAQFEGYSQILNMPTNGSFNFLGGTVNVKVYGGSLNGPGGIDVPQVHSYTFNFPAATLPVPAYSVRPILGSGSGGADRFSIANGSATTGKDSLNAYTSTFIDFANDTVISMVPNAAAGYGDYRMLAQPTVPAAAFVAHPKYAATIGGSVTTSLSQTDRIALDAMYPSGQVFQTSTTNPTTGQPHGGLVPGVTYPQTDTTQGVNLYSASPIVPITQTATTAGSSTAVAGGPPPDFDNGFGQLPDGPYINKPDEGGVYSTNKRVYYDNLGNQINTQAAPSFYFSPQRQVPSPVMFGSLPTGAPVGTLAPKPWQTLLFQPGASGHAGLNAPKDEYLLDLFWMPQAAPYAISEPFSTAGKVNLNYQILPFTYIDRSTAIQSVLCSEKVAQVGAGQASSYKTDSGTTGMGIARQPLNLSETNGTLRQFAAKFSAFSVFKAAAEICDVYLVPQNESWTSDSQAQSAWYGSNYALVGDNTRERPYADIYSRLTTKSNSYTVYYRVQTLKNTSATPATWTEGTGAITGEFRGSTSIERYIDPNLTIPDYATSNLSTTPSLDSPTYYKWRVVENNRFAP